MSVIATPPEPVQVIKRRRDAALAALVSSVPYIAFLGITFARCGNELTFTLPYDDSHIGNPAGPALHGGVTAGFLEASAIVELAWSQLWFEVEEGRVTPAALAEGFLPRLPETIDMTVDYLRSGLPRDAYARARIVRSGRRYASVRVEAWQDDRDRPFAQATGHFLMPASDPAPAPDPAPAADRG
ncbi:PaaI family thioesterase [Palleronia sediminis]|uniref:PaaI family thioesterase n=1 Tax=Palleronia sediminis TaxID=2547833 RepID=A0A4R5ZZW3_9RHOB|nr:PaaI family thioesterase [Palleronia sediminis]TDL74226.1 PaaI family thioesterase [Palleronia sediminis]